jgi:hypothetical protein
MVASGANAKIFMKKQSAYGTAATGDFKAFPVRSFNVSATQPFDQQLLIGRGRQPLRPARDVITVAGTIEVPIDVRYIGHWLTGAFGAVSTTGSSSPYTHVWSTTPTTLPAFTIEKAALDITTPLYFLYQDIMIDRMSLNWEPTGFPYLSLQVTGTSEVKSTSSSAGTPTTEIYTPFSNLQNFVKKDGSSWAKILQAQIEYSNNLDAIRYVGGAGAVGDISPGAIGMSGSIRATMADATIYDLGTAGTLFDLQVGWEISASQKLTFEFEQVELGRGSIPLTGGGRVEQTFPVAASYDESETKALTVTLINDQSTY